MASRRITPVVLTVSPAGADAGASPAIHNRRVSDHVRIGLGILAAAWFFPVLAWTFLAVMSEVRPDAPSAVLLVHRGLPAVILLAAVIAGSWLLVIAAFATAAVTTVVVEVVKRRWPERWDRMGETNS
jgi:hypothetical protein